MQFRAVLERFVRVESGLSFAEYALLAALIGVAIAVAVRLAGPIIVHSFQQGSQGFQDGMAGG
jgi:Flp pilus assembly pilin Flp